MAIGKNELALKTLQEEALSKVGYIGRLFGSGEAAKTNYIGCALVLLVTVAIVTAHAGQMDVFNTITPLIGTMVGYFLKGK